MLKRIGKSEKSYNKMGGNLNINRQSPTGEPVSNIGGRLKIIKEADESKGSLIGGTLKVIGNHTENTNYYNGRLRTIGSTY